MSTDASRADGLSMQSPLIRRFYAWVQERFPLANALLFFALYAAALVSGQVLSGLALSRSTHYKMSGPLPALSMQEPIKLTLTFALGFLGAWGYFLLLRVYDEHKDYALDVKNYPDRVLQSGLITLNHLKVAGVLAALVQLGVTLWLGQGAGPALWCWLVVMGWSALMAKEFFIGEWLEKRLVLYALSHMIVMPMALVWMAHLGAGGQWLQPEIGWLAGASFFSGAAFEVTRKTRAPEEERDTVDSYARVLGLKPACLTILTFLACSVGCQLMLLGAALPQGPGLVWSIACALPLTLPIFQLVKFMREPLLKHRKANEASVALAMLSGYIILIAAMITTHHATLSLTH